MIENPTPVQEIVNYYFELKNWDNRPKQFYKRNHISYARHLKSAKNLLDLCDGDIDKAKDYLDRIRDWAMYCGLNWSIETIFKRYLDLENKLI